MQATKTASSPATAAARAQQADNRAVASPVAQRPIHYPFWFGGSASSMAACVTHPLDLGTLPLCPTPIALPVLTTPPA